MPSNHRGFVSGQAIFMFQSRVGTASALSVAIYLYQPGDGGLDRVAILLANHLLHRGISVELWMTRLEGASAHLIDPELTVRRVPAPEARRRLSMIAQFPALSAMVRQHRPDILYSAGNQSNMLVAMAALGINTRAISRISNPIICPGKRGFSAAMRYARHRFITGLADMTIVMGEHDRRLLARSGDVRLLPRPTVTPEMERAAEWRVPRHPDDPYQLLMVGRLAEQKDHATALHALARLSHIDWRLTVAGQGPLRADLQQLAETLGIADRVRFIGFVADPDTLAHMMASADLLLQPSRWEGLCATVIEALACGASVVATDSTPNIRPILADAGQHPVTPVGNAAAFARAIERALARPGDRARMAVAVRDHGLKSAFDRYLRAFSSLVPMREAAPEPSPVMS